MLAPDWFGTDKVSRASASPPTPPRTPPRHPRLLHPTCQRPNSDPGHWSTQHIRGWVCKNIKQERDRARYPNGGLRSVWESLWHGKSIISSKYNKGKGNNKGITYTAGHQRQITTPAILSSVRSPANRLARNGSLLKTPTAHRYDSVAPIARSLMVIARRSSRAPSFIAPAWSTSQSLSPHASPAFSVHTGGGPHRVCTPAATAR